MGAPDLLVERHPLRPPRGSEGRGSGGGLWGREWHGGTARAGSRVSGIVHQWWCREVLGMDTRQLRGMGPEHVGQHVREVLQQVEPIRHLEGRGGSKAGRFCIGLGPIPPEHLDSGMGLQPPGDGGSFPVRQQGQGPPPFEIQQERAVGVALAQGKLVHAEDLWRADDRAGGAANCPQQGVAADGET